jgi:hypothetical protein
MLSPCGIFIIQRKEETMKIRKSDILGYQIEEELICDACITEDERQYISSEIIITYDDIRNDDETVYFCDRCKKPM